MGSQVAERKGPQLSAWYSPSKTAYEKLINRQRRKNIFPGEITVSHPCKAKKIKPYVFFRENIHLAEQRKRTFSDIPIQANCKLEFNFTRELLALNMTQNLLTRKLCGHALRGLWAAAQQTGTKAVQPGLQNSSASLLHIPHMICWPPTLL